MRFLLLLIIVFLSGCGLFMDKCDSLSGWCVRSKTLEIELWGNKEEIAKINKCRVCFLENIKRKKEMIFIFVD